ncbi:MAG: AAA family ATPase [Candidatus Geothermarchaeota archaeon]
MEALLICTVGLPGSGKSVFVKAANLMNLPTVIMGDIVKKRAKERYGSDSLAYVSEYMQTIRKEYGKDIIARFTVEKIVSEMPNAKVILVDGLRCFEEVEYFRKRGYRVVIIGVYASLKTRFNRVLGRGRSDDVKTLEEFIEREKREVSLGLLDVFRRANYLFINEGISEEEAILDARKLLEVILRIHGYEEEED